jgi:hypothetical protein
METIWNKAVQAFQLHPAIAPFQKGGISDWLRAITRIGSMEQQRQNAGIMLYCWWFVWKECNQRIFLAQREFLPSGVSDY